MDFLLNIKIWWLNLLYRILDSHSCNSPLIVTPLRSLQANEVIGSHLISRHIGCRRVKVFKSKGAGEGFRRFRLGEETRSEKLKVLKAHDLVSVQPFEGAANKTAIIILKKGLGTSYPLPYTLWSRKKGVGKIPTDIVLDEALPFLQKKKLMAQPIGTSTGSWQTITKGQKGLGAIEGKNAYQAHEGGYIVPYGVFWLEIKQVLADGHIIVKNLSESGKWQIQQVEEKIESDLVFPAEYSFSRYRVVWKHMANDIFAAVISQYKTPFGYKSIVSTHTTSLIAVDNENEAHYLCAIINSQPVRDFIKSYSSAGRGFGAPSIMNHVGIPKFDPQNELHQKLAQLSKTLHELKMKNELDKISELEKQNDELVTTLFKIKKS